jgi:predicted DNA-binding protein
MSTTVKRITLALSKNDLKILTKLCEELGESQSVVIKRAITFYLEHFRDIKI